MIVIVSSLMYISTTCISTLWLLFFLLLILMHSAQRHQYVVIAASRCRPLTACRSVFAGRDLRALFGLLRRQGSSHSTPPYAPLLLRTLCIMARHGGPSAFFDFATDSAGILRTTPLQLPTSKGYSFATWLRIEEGATGGGGGGGEAAQGSAGRALYALLNRGSDNRGIIACLSGQSAQSGKTGRCALGQRVCPLSCTP